MVAKSSSVAVEALLVIGNILPSSCLVGSPSSVVYALDMLSPLMNMIEGVVFGCLSLGDG